MNFGETIFNNDLDSSHYSYNIKRVSIRRRVSKTCRKEQKKLLKEYRRKWCTRGVH